MRKSSKKEEDEGDEEEEEEENSEAIDDEEGSSQPIKKRKVAGGKAKAEKVPKPKKGPKRPTEFKKGKWNPHVELVEMDKYKEHP